MFTIPKTRPLFESDHIWKDFQIVTCAVGKLVLFYEPVQPYAGSLQIPVPATVLATVLFWLVAPIWSLSFCPWIFMVLFCIIYSAETQTQASWIRESAPPLRCAPSSQCHWWDLVYESVLSQQYTLILLLFPTSAPDVNVSHSKKNPCMIAKHTVFFLQEEAFACLGALLGRCVYHFLYIP